jgi:hypothetical protein
VKFVAARGGPGAQVLADAGDLALTALDVVAKPFQPVAHLVKAFGVLLFEPGETHHLGIDVRFLDDQRIARSNGFHLGIGERGGVHILGAAHGRVAVHHLGDEAAFRFQRPPHAGVEAALGDIAENAHVFIRVALAEDAALTLLDVGGSPRRVEVMQGHEALLHIGAFAHR